MRHLRLVVEVLRRAVDELVRHFRCHVCGRELVELRRRGRPRVVCDNPNCRRCRCTALRRVGYHETGAEVRVPCDVGVAFCARCAA